MVRMCIYIYIYIHTVLLEDSRLLQLCVSVMRGYQLLSPSVFAQTGFPLGKLIPSLPSLREGRGRECGEAVLMATLSLLQEAAGDCVKWKQQVWLL